MRNVLLLVGGGEIQHCREMGGGELGAVLELVNQLRASELSADEQVMHGRGPRFSVVTRMAQRHSG